MGYDDHRHVHRVLAAPRVRDVEGPPRGHQHAGAPAGFLDQLGGFTGHAERVVAGHDLGVRAARRIPLKDVSGPVIGIGDEAVQ